EAAWDELAPGSSLPSATLPNSFRAFVLSCFRDKKERPRAASGSRTRNQRVSAIPLRSSPMLEEARVGVEWLLKLRPGPEGFYYQVGSAAEHELWQRPEEDDAGPAKAPFPRRAPFGAGANLAGRSAAALALAARLYQVLDPALAGRCEAGALAFYE